jgi:RimJ/RimL family protein N-acetyltransferase
MQADLLPRAVGRVVLRRLALADLRRFQVYRHDPGVGRYQDWEPQPDHEATRFIQEMSQVDLFPSGAWFQLGIAIGSSNELVGDVGVCVAADARRAEVGGRRCCRNRVRETAGPPVWDPRRGAPS